MSKIRITELQSFDEISQSGTPPGLDTVKSPKIPARTGRLLRSGSKSDDLRNDTLELLARSREDLALPEMKVLLQELTDKYPKVDFSDATPGGMERTISRCSTFVEACNNLRSKPGAAKLDFLPIEMEVASSLISLLERVRMNTQLRGVSQTLDFRFQALTMFIQYGHHVDQHANFWRTIAEDESQLTFIWKNIALCNLARADGIYEFFSALEDQFLSPNYSDKHLQDLLEALSMTGVGVERLGLTMSSLEEMAYLRLKANIDALIDSDLPKEGSSINAQTLSFVTDLRNKLTELRLNALEGYYS